MSVVGDESIGAGDLLAYLVTGNGSFDCSKGKISFGESSSLRSLRDGVEEQVFHELEGGGIGGILDSRSHTAPKVTGRLHLIRRDSTFFSTMVGDKNPVFVRC